MADIRIENVTKRFDKFVAVDNVSMTIEDQEFVVLLGPSGCGKTTLLRILAGLEQPDSGSVTLDGADLLSIPTHRRPINLMFQSYALFPHLNVEKNVGYGLAREKRPKDEIRGRVAEVLQHEARYIRIAHDLARARRIDPETWRHDHALISRPGNDLVQLEDDRRLQPAENVVPIVHAAVVDRFGSEAMAALDRVSAVLTTEDSQQGNPHSDLIFRATGATSCRDCHRGRRYHVLAVIQWPAAATRYDLS